mmetsp:Transcript_24328/g.61792  ORF Transcript_24328/g.61792 Transcript_24328/m.61792 type:complete len:222 (+) Transcript_24328:211-876(+)
MARSSCTRLRTMRPASIFLTASGPLGATLSTARRSTAVASARSGWGDGCARGTSRATTWSSSARAAARGRTSCGPPRAATRSSCVRTSTPRSRGWGSSTSTRTYCTATTRRRPSRRSSTRWTPSCARAASARGASPIGNCRAWRRRSTTRAGGARRGRWPTRRRTRSRSPRAPCGPTPPSSPPTAGLSGRRSRAARWPCWGGRAWPRASCAAGGRAPTARG